MTSNFRKLRWLFVRRRRAAELEQELRFHLEEEAQEHGYDVARRQLGNFWANSGGHTRDVGMGLG